MFPILTTAGSGADRLRRSLEALCDLIDRHLPLFVATDEVFHQEPEPGSTANTCSHSSVPARGRGRRLAEPTHGAGRDRRRSFNAVAWTYVHMRGRHEWEPIRARTRSSTWRSAGSSPTETSPDEPAVRGAAHSDRAGPRVVPEPPRRGEPGGEPAASGSPARCTPTPSQTCPGTSLRPSATSPPASSASRGRRAPPSHARRRSRGARAQPSWRRPGCRRRARR
jgi:hypothetical protein